MGSSYNCLNIIFIKADFFKSRLAESRQRPLRIFDKNNKISPDGKVVAIRVNIE